MPQDARGQSPYSNDVDSKQTIYPCETDNAVASKPVSKKPPCPATSSAACSILVLQLHHPLSITALLPRPAQHPPFTVGMLRDNAYTALLSPVHDCRLLMPSLELLRHVDGTFHKPAYWTVLANDVYILFELGLFQRPRRPPQCPSLMNYISSLILERHHVDGRRRPSPYASQHAATACACLHPLLAAQGQMRP